MIKVSELFFFQYRVIAVGYDSSYGYTVIIKFYPIEVFTSTRIKFDYIFIIEIQLLKMNALSFQFIVQISLFNFNFDVGNFNFDPVP